LEDARNTSNHNVTRLEQAYNAILNCAWLALRVEGYRPKSVPGHHQLVIESLAETMGIDNGDVDYFLELAGTRNRDLYDAMPITETDVAEAIEAAANLAEKLERWLDGRGVQAL
jgi:predicted RNase H-like nuclease (RuvC/YqgF family)